MLGLILTYGGWILIPIALTSIATVTVAIERGWRLLPLRRRLEADRRLWIEALALGAPEQALESVPVSSPVGRMGRATLRERPRGEDAMRQAATAAAQLEVTACERGLGVLLASSQVAPLFGLLGTVIGLISAFQGASTAERISASVLSGGIYQALTTTVAGLLVAIPAYLLYVGLVGIVGRLTQQIERIAEDLVRVETRV